MVAGIRTFACDRSIAGAKACGKRFERRHDLNRHVKVHLGILEYKCTLCSRSFAQKNGLDVHKKTHNGARTHACPLSRWGYGGDCPVLPFRDDSSYRRHWQNKHADIPPRFPCPVSSCNFSGARKALLRNHMRERHGRDLPAGMKERQPRGAHGIDVPPAVFTKVYDCDLEAQGHLARSCTQRSRRPSSRVDSLSPSPRVLRSRPSTGTTLRSPSYERDDEPYDEEFSSGLDTPVPTPASVGVVATPEIDFFSFKVPPPVIAPNMPGADTRKSGDMAWAPPPMLMAPPPMFEYHVPVPHIAPMNVPTVTLNGSPLPMDFGRTEHPAPEPFGILDDSTFGAAPSPVPYDEMSQWMELWQPTPDPSSFMIDPALLNNDFVMA